VTKHLERVVLRRALRGKKRSLVAADAVVQKRACELDVDHRPSSTTDRSLAAFDLFERASLFVAPGVEPRPLVSRADAPCCLADHVRLFQSRG